MNKLTKAESAYLMNCKSNEQSNTTIEQLERIFRLFGESMQRNGHADICMEAVRDWRAEMNDRELSPTTMNLYLGVMRTFNRWAVEMKYIAENYFTDAVMPSRKAVARAKKKHYENLMPMQDYMTILGRTERPKGHRVSTWRRDRAILMVFLLSGIRNSELRSVTINDLNARNNTITIRHGKGDKFRYATYPREAQQAVREYLDDGYRPATATDSDWLFGIEKDGEWKQMSRVSLSQSVKRTVNQILGNGGMMTHALRHAFASVMYDAGVPLDEIRDLLGHESVSTTEVYAERLRPNAPTESASMVFEKLLGGCVGC